jgi:tRNA (mo5U34)-methyltransferase
MERAVHFGIPADLSGKRVLDVGCADGFFSFLAEQRGAEVIAIDCDPRPSFWIAHDILESKVELASASIYDVDPGMFGLFDIVFFFGVYYHLRYPLLALDRIAKLTREWALIESAIILGPEGTYSQFLEGSEFNDDPTNWWLPTVPCLLATIRSSGFAKVEMVSIYDEQRCVVRATK